MTTPHTKRSVAALKTGDQKALFLAARDAYYNNAGDGEPLMSDAVFDHLEELLTAKVPNWVKNQGTGAPVAKAAKSAKLGKKVERTLSVPCPSLSKLKAGEPDTLARWVKKAARYAPYVLRMPKFDGSSLFAHYVGGKLLYLATRGDGNTGKDITFLAPHTTLPQSIKDKGNLCFRFEAIVKRDVWQAKWRKEFKGDRAMASAVFNRQDAHPALKDVDLIVVRAYNLDANRFWNLSESLVRAKALGFKTTPFKPVALKDLDDATLTSQLQQMLKTSPYALDGMVLHSDAAGLVPVGDEKPEWAMAFKLNVTEEDAPEATIEAIDWQVSHTGRIAPVARITPTDFGGVTVSNVSIHNPKMAIENGWGVGAVVKVIRAGEIIPKIIATVTRKKFKLPAVAEVGKYARDENGTHIYLTDDSRKHEVLAKQLQRCMTSLGIEHAASSVATALSKNGCPSAMGLIRALFDDPVKVFTHAGASEKMATKIAATVPQSLTIGQLMHASCMFPEGFGQRRFNQMLAATSVDWYDIPTRAVEPVPLQDCIKMLGQVFGTEFFDNQLRFYKAVLKSKGIVLARPKVVKVKLASSKLAGQRVSFTGYRSEDQEQAVIKNGGEVVSFGNKTTILLFKVDGKASSKVDKAHERGIIVTTFNKLGI